MAAPDKNWAQDYLINPLHAPEPSDETGPGTHFRSTFAATTPVSQRSGGAIPAETVRAVHNDKYYDPNVDPTRKATPVTSGTRSRGHSQSERKKASHKGHRKRISDVDTIDALDSVLPGGQYHHEGPFDATLMSHNLNPKSSPVAAVRDSNMEAIRATPRENILDAVQGHRPLDNVAQYPPGNLDPNGRAYDYDEYNVNAEGRDDLQIDGKHKNKDRYDIGSGVMTKVETNDEPQGDGTAIELQEQPYQKKHVEIKADEVDGHEGSSKHPHLSGLKKRLSLKKKKNL